MKFHTSITEYVFCTFLSCCNPVYREKREKSLFFCVPFLTTVKADSFARTSSFMQHTKTLLPPVSFSRFFIVVAKP